jgi:hypothetical protein
MWRLVSRVSVEFLNVTSFYREGLNGFVIACSVSRLKRSLVAYFQC